jgi:hypothetical protein
MIATFTGAMEAGPYDGKGFKAVFTFNTSSGYFELFEAGRVLYDQGPSAAATAFFEIEGEAPRTTTGGNFSVASVDVPDVGAAHNFTMPFVYLDAQTASLTASMLVSTAGNPCLDPGAYCGGAVIDPTHGFLPLVAKTYSLVVDNSDGFIEPVFGQAAVPEPATWAMMVIGFFGLGGAIRARRRSTELCSGLA